MQGTLLKNICGFSELIKLVILVTGRLLSCVGSSKHLPCITLSLNSYSPGCPQKPSVETPGMMAVDTRKSAGQLFQAPWGQQGHIMVTVKLEEDHPRNQGLSLPETQPPAWEIFRQQFRHFCYQDSPGPRLALSQLHPALPSVAQTRDTHQGDPGPAGAGAVPVHPAPGVPGPSSGALVGHGQGMFSFAKGSVVY